MSKAVSRLEALLQAAKLHKGS